MVAWIGGKQVPLPYDRKARVAGESKYPLSKMVRFAADAITAFSVVPLMAAMTIGWVMAAVGFAFFVYSIVGWLAGANLRPVAIEPFLATAFNCCRASIGREPAWLAAAEPGRVCVAYLADGGWRRLRSERVRMRLEDELPLALERLRLDGPPIQRHDTVFIGALDRFLRRR